MGSVKTKVRRNKRDLIKLSSPRGWMPLIDNANEYIQVINLLLIACFN